MKEVINPGNVLPVYERVTSQMCYRAGCAEFNWAIPVKQGFNIPIQIPVPSGTFGTWDWTYIEVGIDVENALDAALLKYSETEDGQAWVSYHGDGTVIPGRACGDYYFHFYSTAGYHYYSEVIRVLDMNDARKMYRLDFSHDKDVDGILYQGGYSQKVWIRDAVFDTPDVVKPTEVIPDGNAVEVMVFQSVQVRDVLRFPNFPDFWHSVFHRLEMYDNVTLTSIETGEVFDLSDKQIRFSTEGQDVCFKRAILSWICSTQVMDGCEVNNSMVYLNNGLVG